MVLAWIALLQVCVYVLVTKRAIGAIKEDRKTNGAAACIVHLFHDRNISVLMRWNVSVRLPIIDL